MQESCPPVPRAQGVTEYLQHLGLSMEDSLEMYSSLLLYKLALDTFYLQFLFQLTFYGGK